MHQGKNVAKIYYSGASTLILRVPLFVSCYLIKKHLLHIISYVCAQFVSQISSFTLMIPLNLSCYENAAKALVCNGCTVANDAYSNGVTGDVSYQQYKRQTSLIERAKCFGLFEALRPGQHFFDHFGTSSWV